MDVLIYGLVGVGAVALIVYLLMRSKVKRTVFLDLDTEQENKKLREEYTYLHDEYVAMRTQRESMADNLEILEKQAKQSADVFYKKNMEIAQQNLESSLEKFSREIQESKEQCEAEYLSILKELADQVQIKTEEVEKIMAELDEELSEKQSIVNAAVEASKRAREMEEEKDFYKLQLSELDIEEIEKLRSIVPYLRNAEPINKVIWKVYYEKPYTDLIGRVLGSGTHTGIYKITNIQNNMCYVGQAANISERWRQHIKRGVGAETATRNKLYPAMQEFGVENFTFEMIEECDRTKLDSREDYWQDYFKAKEFGYSIK